MSRAENRIIDRIDRRRERKAETQVRELRRLQIGEDARARVNCAALNFDDPAERLEWLKAAAWKIRALFVSVQDDAGAVAFFGSLAAAHDSVLPRAISKANAERLFTKAANDGGPE
ncbi:hypothetical protein [Brevundimonas sp. NIBR11]|uniref:hypothetical protein n=1 Tax=Brevundimonas sp. NIBR11 TaxID=3015999 RepID=UPI0022F1017F|nr:hypothetical protein [Brevundimonas sp. NIBR11]WGM31479.1 hypothetical protein KKHFBJBL_01726 [Brevundimonas sp. NIBR11]